MISYSLKCADGHSFDSWFESAQAYDRLSEAGMLECAVCGNKAVEKALMAPRISTGNNEGTDKGSDSAPLPTAIPADPKSRALAKLRRHIETVSEDVGRDFVREARAIHVGDAPARSIHGLASPTEARQLINEDVPVLPLPFPPGPKVN